MNNNKSILEYLHYAKFILWGTAILIGAMSGGSDGSIAGGIFGGFMFGLGIAIMVTFIQGVIYYPRRLTYFLFCIPPGFFIGYFWGWDGALIGVSIGGVIAILLVADLIKKK